MRRQTSLVTCRMAHQLQSSRRPEIADPYAAHRSAPPLSATDRMRQAKTLDRHSRGRGEDANRWTERGTWSGKQWTVPGNWQVGGSGGAGPRGASAGWAAAIHRRVQAADHSVGRGEHQIHPPRLSSRLNDPTAIREIVSRCLTDSAGAPGTCGATRRSRTCRAERCGGGGGRRAAYRSTSDFANAEAGDGENATGQTCVASDAYDDAVGNAVWCPKPDRSEARPPIERRAWGAAKRWR